MLAKLKEITQRGKGKIIIFDIMGSERRLDELIMKSILSSYTDLSSGVYVFVCMNALFFAILFLILFIRYF